LNNELLEWLEKQIKDSKVAVNRNTETTSYRKGKENKEYKKEIKTKLWIDEIEFDEEYILERIKSLNEVGIDVKNKTFLEVFEKLSQKWKESITKDNGDYICPYCGYILFNKNCVVKEILDDFLKYEEFNCPVCKEKIINNWR